MREPLVFAAIVAAFGAGFLVGWFFAWMARRAIEAGIAQKKDGDPVLIDATPVPKGEVRITMADGSTYTHRLPRASSDDIDELFGPRPVR